MFVAFIKDESVQLDAMLMANYNSFNKNASMIGSMHQVGTVKPQEVLGTGWTELNKISTDGTILNTDAVMYMYKVGQTGQIYKTPGVMVFVGQDYIDCFNEHGLELIGTMAEELILAGQSYSVNDGRLSPLQIMVLTMAVQVVGMDTHELPTTAVTADLDGTPALLVHSKQMTMNAMTYSTVLGQNNNNFAGMA